METVFLALLFGAALWLGDLYNASKFRNFYPKLQADFLPRGAAKWKRVWIYRNQVLKHAGLFMMWAGVTLGTHFSGVSETGKSEKFYVVGFFGFLLYLASRLWPTLVGKPRPRR